MKYEAVLVIPRPDNKVSYVFFDNRGNRYTEYTYEVPDPSQYFEKYIALGTPASWTVWDSPHEAYDYLEIIDLLELEYLHFFEVDDQGRYTYEVLHV